MQLQCAVADLHMPTATNDSAALGAALSEYWRPRLPPAAAVHMNVTLAVRRRRAYHAAWRTTCHATWRMTWQHTRGVHAADDSRCSAAGHEAHTAAHVVTAADHSAHRQRAAPRCGPTVAAYDTRCYTWQAASEMPQAAVLQYACTM